MLTVTIIVLEAVYVIACILTHEQKNGFNFVITHNENSCNEQSLLMVVAAGIYHGTEEGLPLTMTIIVCISFLCCYEDVPHHHLVPKRMHKKWPACHFLFAFLLEHACQQAEVHLRPASHFATAVPFMVCFLPRLNLNAGKLRCVLQRRQSCTISCGSAVLLPSYHASPRCAVACPSSQKQGP